MRLAWIAGVLAATVLAAPVAGAQTSCADLGGAVEAGVCQVHTSTAGYTIEMSVPVDYPDQQAVFGELAQRRAGFTDWIARFAPDGLARPYQLDVSAQTFRSAGTRSLVLQVESNTGLANEGHPDTVYTAFNYDLNTHTPITFDTLFTPGTVAVLNTIVGHRLDARAYRNFALTEDAVTFFFGQDELIADHAGPHQISVPRAQLGV